jgi:hypothetical protein
MYFLKQKEIFINLIIYSILWGVTSNNYYLLTYYMRYLPGNVYDNSFASSGSEILASVVAGVSYSFLKAKNNFRMAFTIAILGSLLVVFFGNLSTKLMPVFVIIAKFGISIAYFTVYVATADSFPTLFCATAFGVCNFTGNIITIPAAYISELNQPWPMLVYASASALGLLLTFFIKDANNVSNPTAQTEEDDKIE